jgi:hypothetical protein
MRQKSNSTPASSETLVRRRSVSSGLLVFNKPPRRPAIKV